MRFSSFIQWHQFDMTMISVYFKFFSFLFNIREMILFNENYISFNASSIGIALVYLVVSKISTFAFKYSRFFSSLCNIPEYSTNQQIQKKTLMLQRKEWCSRIELDPKSSNILSPISPLIRFFFNGDSLKIRCFS